MRILIVEDDTSKSEQLVALVREIAPDADLVERRSYQSGLKLVLDERPDLVLLDMSMPTFDVTATDKGWRPRFFGGRDILDEIARHEIDTRVVVVTQCDTFGEGRDTATLSELERELAEDFAGICLGLVFYHRAQSAWRGRLSEIVTRAVMGSG